MNTAFTIEALYVDGRKTTHDFEQDQTVVGSSPEADLYIDLAELSLRHLLILPRKGACWVSVANDAKTPVLCKGIPIDNQEVPWGTDLDIGTVTLRICESKRRVVERERRYSTWLYLLGVAVLALVVVTKLRTKPVSYPAPPSEAPKILNFIAVACEPESGTRTTYAGVLRGEALSRWHRYAFDPQEGVRALQVYEKAAFCYQMQGKKRLAEATRLEAKEKREKMERDYQSARLQLSRALRGKEHEMALRYTWQLMRLTAHVGGDYSAWLRTIARYLNQKIVKPKDGKKKKGFG